MSFSLLLSLSVFRRWEQRELLQSEFTYRFQYISCNAEHSTWDTPSSTNYRSHLMVECNFSSSISLQSGSCLAVVNLPFTTPSNGNNKIIKIIMQLVRLLCCNTLAGWLTERIVKSLHRWISRTIYDLPKSYWHTHNHRFGISAGPPFSCKIPSAASLCCFGCRSRKPYCFLIAVAVAAIILCTFCAFDNCSNDQHLYCHATTSSWHKIRQTSTRE